MILSLQLVHAHPLGQPMGFVLASIRTKYGPVQTRGMTNLSDLNDGPSQDRWYPFSTMTRHDRVQPRGKELLSRKPVSPTVKPSYHCSIDHAATW
jgi:hypothetical protein